jgi:CRP-like cAMP-binding protein
MTTHFRRRYEIYLATRTSQFVSGTTVYPQQTPADSIAIVLSGRLREIQLQSDGEKRVIAEYGRCLSALWF